MYFNKIKQCAKNIRLFTCPAHHLVLYKPEICITDYPNIHSSYIYIHYSAIGQVVCPCPPSCKAN